MIKKPDYCPEWFNLENYEPCKKFNRASWHRVFLSRLIYFDVSFLPEQKKRRGYEKGIKHASSHDYLLKLSIDNRSINKIHESGILDFSAYEFLGTYEYFKTNHPDFLNFVDECMEKEKQHPDKFYWFEEVIESEKTPSINLESPSGRQILGMDAFLIAVNMNANDESLVQDFQEWLKEKRKLHYAKKEFYKRLTESELSKLVYLNILPCIDLILWGEATNNQLKYHQIARLIYPNEYDIDINERVRKVSIPLAKKLIERGMNLLR